MISIITQDIKKTFSKYAGGVKKTPRFLGRYAFTFTLLFIFLEMVVVAVLCWQYIFLPRSKQIEAGDSPAVFNERTYQSVLKEWARRQQAIETSATETYNDPF